jgi:hypothetical protein
MTADLGSVKPVIKEYHSTSLGDEARQDGARNRHANIASHETSCIDLR